MAAASEALPPMSAPTNAEMALRKAGSITIFLLNLAFDKILTGALVLRSRWTKHLAPRPLLRGGRHFSNALKHSVPRDVQARAATRLEQTCKAPQR
jgi:hypothetical protein